MTIQNLKPEYLINKKVTKGLTIPSFYNNKNMINNTNLPIVYGKRITKKNARHIEAQRCAKNNIPNDSLLYDLTMYGTAYYSDEECTKLLGVDPYQSHRKNKVIILNSCRRWLVMVK